MTSTLTLLLILPSVFYLIRHLTSKRSSYMIFHTGNNISGAFNLMGILSAIVLYKDKGSHSIELALADGLGFSIRIDTISLLMYSMVSFIIFLVYRFSINYLSGDSKFRKYSGAFSLVAGTVQLLVISGNLLSFFIFWVITSIGLSQLLTLYPERKDALRAARTKFIIARLADLTLMTAFIMMYAISGTGEIQNLLYDDKYIHPIINAPSAPYIAGLLALTAILKSVQFPFHTWIFGVLESPTTVSALLHAGLLNAGPFLVIRFSRLFEGMEGASTLLLVSGAISALFGSAVYITQSSIKTGLVFSSIAHMGFSLMLCGLGLYPAAMLHLVSHSFYKAYLFLSSGSAVEAIRTGSYRLYQRTGSAFRILMAMILTTAIYILANAVIEKYIEFPESMTYVGTIIITGVYTLLSYSMDSKNSVVTNIKTVAVAILMVVLFHVMEHVMHALSIEDMPPIEKLGALRSALMTIFTCLFIIGAILQMIVMTPKGKDLWTGLRVHLRNGFYVESILRRIGTIRRQQQ